MIEGISFDYRNKVSLRLRPPGFLQFVTRSANLHREAISLTPPSSKQKDNLRNAFESSLFETVENEMLLVVNVNSYSSAARLLELKIVGKAGQAGCCSLFVH